MYYKSLIASSMYINDEAMKRYIIPHHVHIGSDLAYLLLNYDFNGTYSSKKHSFVNKKMIGLAKQLAAK